MPEPTIEQMKQALRVAEEALKKIASKNYTGATFIADKALTQISPILEEMKDG